MCCVLCFFFFLKFSFRACVVSMLTILFLIYRLGDAISEFTKLYCFLFLFLQEIKFEPNVMCEPIDKKVTFRTSQVSYIHNWCTILFRF